MRFNLVGAFIRNHPHGSEIVYAKGLREAGHEVTTCDPSRQPPVFDEQADATIVFKWIEGEHRQALSRIGGKKIVYQPDDLRFAHIQREMKEMSTVCDYAFTFEAVTTEIAKWAGFKDSRTLLLTADPELYRPRSSILGPGALQDIDVSFIANVSNEPGHKSRGQMVQLVSALGLRFFFGSVWDMGKVNEIYHRSKIVLHHATDVGQAFGSGYGLQCRHFEAGLTKACVLSNDVIGPHQLKNIAVFKDRVSLVDQIRQLLADESRRVQLAEGLYEEIRTSHLPVHRGEQIAKLVTELG